MSQQVLMTASTLATKTLLCPNAMNWRMPRAICLSKLCCKCWQLYSYQNITLRLTVCRTRTAVLHALIIFMHDNHIRVYDLIWCTGMWYHVFFQLCYWTVVVIWVLKESLSIASSNRLWDQATFPLRSRRLFFAVFGFSRNGRSHQVCFDCSSQRI